MIAQTWVSIGGRVVDGVTRRPLPGVRVVIGDGSRRAETAADGTFRFVNLLDGDYVLSFSLPGAGLRYGVTTQSVRATKGSPAVVTVLLPPTGVSGKVDYPAVEPAPTEPIYPLVRLVGSGEEVYGDADGGFRLLAIEPGREDRTVVITVPGWEPTASAVRVTWGEVSQIAPITLTARAPGT